jgi:hypothetical protein
LNIDLDAAKAARLEKSGEEHTLTFGGETFTLPQELPVPFGEALGRVVTVIDPKTKEERQMLSPDVIAATKALLDGQAERFLALKPSYSDIAELVNRVSGDLGGRTLGESPASRSSSKSTTKSSRPRSKRSTT